MEITYCGITVRGDRTESELKQIALEEATRLRTFPAAPRPADFEAVEAEETERLDLSTLGRQVAAELAWLDTTVSSIDDYAAAQVRDVVKRLAQENRAVLRALRFVVRRLA